MLRDPAAAEEGSQSNLLEKDPAVPKSQCQQWRGSANFVQGSSSLQSHILKAQLGLEV